MTHMYTQFIYIINYSIKGGGISGKPMVWEYANGFEKQYLWYLWIYIIYAL